MKYFLKYKTKTVSTFMFLRNSSKSIWRFKIPNYFIGVYYKGSRSLSFQSYTGIQSDLKAHCHTRFSWKKIWLAQTNVITLHAVNARWKLVTLLLRSTKTIIVRSCSLSNGVLFKSEGFIFVKIKKNPISQKHTWSIFFHVKLVWSTKQTYFSAWKGNFHENS